MEYLLDTNAISLLMREDRRMASWLSSVRGQDRVVTCTICRGEVLFGLRRLVEGRRRSELEAKASRLFGAIPCEAVPPNAGDFYADVKLTRQKQGLSLDENDLWIAATSFVRAVGQTIVFRRLPARGALNLAVLFNRATKGDPVQHDLFNASTRTGSPIPCKQSVG